MAGTTGTTESVSAKHLPLAEAVEAFIKAGFQPHFDELREGFCTNPTWQKMRELGTDLWLDTGSLDEAGPLWTQEFSSLTTNNTLLNREVQKGQYDDVIAQAAGLFSDYGLSEQQLMLEIAFILNARHALKLVERFDAFVSVEEHTALAHNVAASVEYARRYYHICPERFIVKIPFTPAGLLATRFLSDEGVPVNHTLGFSARQNYVIARLGRPSYVNVFLGRLNSFVVDNKLGDGLYVGERATLASQAAIRQLREEFGLPSLQIGASFRAGGQVRDLTGIDVMTMPPKVAQEFLDLQLPADQITDRTMETYGVAFKPDVDPAAITIDSLWNIDQEIKDCVDALEQENMESFTPSDLVEFFRDHGCGDFMVDWTSQEIETSYKEGKIPKIDNWRQALLSGRCSLDSLMNLAGLNSFTVDQKAMDDRVRGVLAKKA